MKERRDNFAVTVHKLGSLAAGSCHLAGVSSISPARSTSRARGLDKQNGKIEQVKWQKPKSGS